MAEVENPSAFPHPEPRNPEFTTIATGMSLRDWFAGQALAGFLATARDFHDEESDGWEWHARAAYAMADTMLAERERAQ